MKSGAAKSSPRPQQRRHLRTSRGVGLALLGVGLIAACGPDDESGPGNLGLDSVVPVRPYSDVACQGRDERLSGQRLLRRFRAGAIDPAPYVEGIARYYARHGLSFTTRGLPGGVAYDYALDTDTSALAQELPRAFPSVDPATLDSLEQRDPAKYREIQFFIINYIFRPMIRFAESQGNVGTETTNLVFVSQVIRPGGMDLVGRGKTLLGLAISPALLAVLTSDERAADEASLWKGVAFPADFTPMLFIDDTVMQKVAARAPVILDLTLAHEFGHTAALIHRAPPTNLMTPAAAVGRSSCKESLDDDQLALMAKTLNVGPSPKNVPSTKPRGLGLHKRLEGPLAQANADSIATTLSGKNLSAVFRGDQAAAQRLFESLLAPLH